MRQFIVILISVIIWSSCAQEQVREVMSCETPNASTGIFSSGEVRVGSLPGDCPYLTRDASGRPVLSWVSYNDDGSAVLRYAVSADSGRTFGNPVTIAASVNINPHAENLPKVIFKPSGEIIAVWGIKNPRADNKYGGLLYYAQSFDNGQHWSDARRLVDDPEGYDQRYADVALLKNGEAAIIWLDNRVASVREGSALYFAQTSGNRGFQQGRSISEPACECCRTSLFTDRKGNIHALYRGILNDSIRDMMYMVSYNEGRTFKAAKRLQQDDWVLRGCPHTGPAMTENSSGLYFAWYTGGRNKGSYCLRTADNGNTFVDHDNITVKGTHPQLTALSDDRVAIVWDESYREGNEFVKRVNMQVRNDDGGKIIQQTITGNTGDASYPVIVPVQKNVVVVAYSQELAGKKHIQFQRVELKD